MQMMLYRDETRYDAHGCCRQTILLVEDEDSVRRLMKRVLELCNYHVLEASNGREGLAIAEQYASTIDLIISDVILPEMSGRDMVEQVRAMYPDIRVLFMSGYTDDIVLRHGIGELGSFLQKPFPPDVLLHRVGMMLDAVGARC